MRHAVFRGGYKHLRIKGQISYNSGVDFKVFLSYSADPEEQAIVWRLQTLATAHGIQVYVPPRAGFRLPSGRTPPVPADTIRRQIDSSDCVLAILASGLSPEVEKELSYALGKNKIIVPIVADGTGHARFLNKFPKVFSFSPWSNVGEIETQVVEFLKEQMRNKAQRQALGALVGIGLGLFLLSAAAKQ
jgi:hypothetical protein